jgi:hypothetical protein
LFPERIYYISAEKKYMQQIISVHIKSTVVRIFPKTAEELNMDFTTAVPH